jgi:probable phosphoglycerate mutase
MISPVPFYYIRHGQTDWNLTGRLQGNSDIPLNETGKAQARAARDRMSGRKVAAIFCSPLVRARQTADIVNEALGCRVTELDGLRECDFDLHEGSRRPDWIDDWLGGNGNGLPAEVEPFEAFVTRAANAINQALRRPGPVLIVAHAGTYIPVNKCLPRRLRWRLPNAWPVRHIPPADNSGGWDLDCL